MPDQIKPTNVPTPKTSQVGRCGELLVQYEMLRHGIESAPMTTDSGVDLVAYPPAMQKAVTIQVKACLKPKKAGGRGDPLLSWGLHPGNHAEMIALVDLETEVVWMMKRSEFDKEAQQRRPDGMTLYRFTTPVRPGSRRSKGLELANMDRYRLSARIAELFR